MKLSSARSWETTSCFVQEHSCPGTQRVLFPRPIDEELRRK